MLFLRKERITLLSGSKLQYIRRLRNVTQEQIADEIGVSERWVSKVECENSSISQETYDKWVNALYKTYVKVDKRTKAYKEAHK